MLCGGKPGIKIVTRPEIVLSIGLTVSTENFFDANYLIRNIAALFGIGTHRLKIAGGNAAAARRRRQLSVSNQTTVDVVISQELACDVVACGAHSHCFEGECVCEEGWHTLDGCEEGSCACSRQDCADRSCETCADGYNASCTSCGAPLPWLHGGQCVAQCGTGYYGDNSTGLCSTCHDTCLTCSTSENCTSCRSLGTHAYFLPSTSSGNVGGGTCEPTCPDGYYADAQRHCQPCDSS